jgi:hypothetical protein
MKMLKDIKMINILKRSKASISYTEGLITLSKELVA